MKKFALTLILCCLLTSAVFSCGSEKKSSKVSESQSSSAESTTAENTTEEKTTEKKAEKPTEEEKTTSVEKTTVVEVNNDASSLSAPAENTPELEEVRAFVRKFMDSTAKMDTEAMMECLYPKAALEAMYNAGMKEFMSGLTDSAGEESILEEFSISDEMVLSPKALNNAKAYLESSNKMFDDKELIFSVSSGYSMKVHTKIKYKDQTSENTESISVVMLDGEGWKLIEMSGEALNNLEMHGDVFVSISSPD